MFYVLSYCFSYFCSICACLVLSVSSFSSCFERLRFIIEDFSLTFDYFCHCMSLHVHLAYMISCLSIFWEKLFLLISACIVLILGPLP